MSDASLSGLLSTLSPPDDVTPPNFTIIRRSISRILDEYGRPKARDRDPAKVLAEMKRRIEENDWSNVPLSFVMEAGEISFSAAWRENDGFARVRQFFLDEVPASDRPGFLDAMTRIYIESFDAAAEHTRKLAAVLRQTATRLGAKWRQVLERFPNLFDPARAALDIAKAMTGLEDIWAGLREIGLRRPHAPGLMMQAHREFLNLMSARLTERAEIDRVLAWLKPDGQPALATGAAEAIAALLRPWRVKGVPEDIKQLLMDRLLDFYGHPKVSRNAIWNQVPEDLEGLFLHWLTGADIRMLFRVLNEVERGHMWADREEFWWGLYQKKRIDEVWVAFNPEGYRAAMSKLPRDQRHRDEHVRFALQKGGKDKSLLIMRIGRKIVVEGTYNFKVHIFPADHQNAPKLYRPQYDVTVIRRLRGANAIPHLGRWQDKVLMEL